MQEACEVQSGDNKALPDKNTKRKFKTPDQVAALEKLYSENKHPSEELRAQYAVSIGLTDKQVSGWFCHRRLKEKRGELSASVKQDRSSGIIIHKQDSCGSNKEGANLYFDHKEVQSRGYNTHNPLAADVAYEKNIDLDDTSSDSSSHLQNRLCSNSGPADVAAFGMENVGIRARSGPSGYLKVKARQENPADVAIASVKRQMGRYYREDGPSLSVEFDLLPPGAFESSANNPENEPQNLSIPDLQLSPVSCDMYNVEMTPRNPHLDSSKFRAKPPSHGHDNYISHQFMPKPGFSNRCAPFLKRKSSTELEGFSSEIPVYNNEKLYKMPGQNYLPYKPGNVSPEQVQRQHLETKGMFKDDKFIREMSAINGSSKSATAQGGKRVWEEFLEQRCRRKSPKDEQSLWTNRTKRTTAADMPSSFSEDEMEETSSTGD